MKGLQHIQCVTNARALAFLTFAISTLFLCRAHHEALTYVCGNDPMLYMRAARVLLNPGLHGSEAVMHSLSFVAPGFPLLLAGCIAVFGDLSVYWLNLVLLIITVPFLWQVLNHTMRSPLAASLAVLGWLAIVMGGHPLNVPFMMYPFRETSRLLCVILCYWLLCRRGDTPAKSPVVPIVAGALLVLACAIREPSVLVVPGAMLGALMLLQERQARVRSLGWLALPFGVAGLVGAIAAVSLGFLGSMQFTAESYIFEHAVAVERMQTMLAWFPAEISWPGIALIVFGIVRSARRAPVLLVWFLLPAVLFFVFYAYMQMHTRYFLTTLVFLAPFAGYGFDALVSLVLSRIPSVEWQRRLQVASVLMCFAGAAVVLADITRDVQPWGPTVRRGDVRAWQARVDALAPGEDGRVRIALEQRCRYLEDLLLGYTDARIMDPKTLSAWESPWAPVNYFKPLDRAALYATPQWLPDLRLFAHRILAFENDLVVSDNHRESTFALGDGHFEWMEMRPRSSGSRTVAFNLPEGGAVLWLDFGYTEDPQTVLIELRSRENGAALDQSVRANGLVALHIPENTLLPGPIMGELSGAGPLPANPVVGCFGLGDALFLDMGAERPMSVNLMFPRLAPHTITLFPVGLKMQHDLVFLPPVLYGNQGAQLHARFHYNSVHDSPHLVMCRGDTGTPISRDIQPGLGYWRVPLPTAGALQMQLVQSRWPSILPPLIVNGVEIWAKKSNSDQDVERSPDTP